MDQDAPTPSQEDTFDQAKFLAEGKCDVCGRSPIIGVASSSFGAVSHGYCKECVNKPAEPLYMFGYLYDFVGHNGDGLADHVKQWFSWKDGKYISWQEYADLRAKEPLCEKHGTHMDNGKCPQCDYENLSTTMYEGPEPEMPEGAFDEIGTVEGEPDDRS